MRKGTAMRKGADMRMIAEVKPRVDVQLGTDVRTTAEVRKGTDMTKIVVDPRYDTGNIQSRINCRTSGDSHSSAVTFLTVWQRASAPDWRRSLTQAMSPRTTAKNSAVQPSLSLTSS